MGVCKILRLSQKVDWILGKSEILHRAGGFTLTWKKGGMYQLGYDVNPQEDTAAVPVSPSHTPVVPTQPSTAFPSLLLACIVSAAMKQEKSY